jgi:hypothetical protein
MVTCKGLGTIDLYWKSHNLYESAGVTVRVLEDQRKPTEACHTKASNWKKRGMIGMMSTNGPKL